MQRPIIGIAPTYDEGFKIPDSRATYYLRREYTQILASVGATPIVLNYDMPLGAILSLCDGIVISGGEDIEPRFYNEELLDAPGAIREPETRTEWDFKLLEACDEVGMPTLGICYGMQLLNVYYGGTLHQDIPSERPDALNHLKTTHNVRFIDDFLGFKTGLVKPVASRHHQAVDVLAEGATVSAEAPDGIIEAIKIKNHFGMQWHPESDETGAHVYRAFVEQAAPGLVH